MNVRFVFASSAVLLLLAPSLALAQAAAPAPSPSLDGSVALFLGRKSMDGNDWRPVQNQTELGVQTTWAQHSWPFAIAGDVFYSSDSGHVSGPLGSASVSATEIEVGLGARKVFVVQQLRPFVGVGLDIAHAEVSASPGSSGSDTGVGAWLGGGATVRVTPQLDLGAQLRWSSAKVTMNDNSGDAGGLHFGVIVGYAFGAN